MYYVFNKWRKDEDDGRLSSQLDGNLCSLPGIICSVRLKENIYGVSSFWQEKRWPFFPARLTALTGCVSRHSWLFWVSDISQNVSSSFCFEPSHSPQFSCTWSLLYSYCCLQMPPCFDTDLLRCGFLSRKLLLRLLTLFSCTGAKKFSFLWSL